MKIVLSKEDIESLVKKCYNGIISIEFKEEQIFLDVNFELFAQPKINRPVNNTPQPPPKKPTLEEKNVGAARAGAMATGQNSKRHMMNF